MTIRFGMVMPRDVNDENSEDVADMGGKLLFYGLKVGDRSAVVNGAISTTLRKVLDG
ncbi:MAG: hypothetical protein AAF583_15590 [Pseudomonadota bacterium]